MNWLDGVIIINLALSTWGGWGRGFARTVMPIIGLLAGWLLASRYYPGVAERLPLSPEWAAKGAASLLIVAVAVAAASLLGWLVSRFLSLTPLGWADRIAGAALGLGLGGLTAAVGLSLLVKFQLLGMESIVDDSALAPYLLGRFSTLLSLLPGSWASVRSFFR